MAPRRRTRCALAVVPVLLLAAPRAQAGESAPPVPEPGPTASESFAGRPAGEGRPRPGRSPVSETPTPPQEPSASRSGPAAPSPNGSVSHSRPGSPTATATPKPHRTSPGHPSDSDSGYASDNRLPDGSGADPLDPEPAGEDEAHDGDDTSGEEAPTVASPSGPPHEAARQQRTEAVPEPVARQVSPLSLGVGMALMGLGIGFLGIRMRRR